MIIKVTTEFNTGVITYNVLEELRPTQTDMPKIYVRRTQISSD